MDKRELKIKVLEETEKLFDWGGDGHEVIKIGDLLTLIDQLDEPEKPVIPSFVAEWIERQLAYGYEDVFIAMKRVMDGGSYRLINWFDSNQDTFSRAWLGGYMVEEKKYHVTDGNDTILCKVDGKVMTVGKVWAIGNEQEAEYELTEKEIEDYDPRYVSFAEPVQP